MQRHRPSTEECAQSFRLKVRNANARRRANQRAVASAIYDQKADASGNARLRESEREYYELGSVGVGKTHLTTGLCVAACRQRRRVRFTTAAALVNELVEAKNQNHLRRTMARWLRYQVIAIDEVGYVPLADVGAELLFQVIADRAERATVLITTNLPFSEWTQVFTNARLCKALLDRITDRAHIIETGSESYRFKRSIEKRQRKAG